MGRRRVLYAANRAARRGGHSTAAPARDRRNRSLHRRAGVVLRRRRRVSADSRELRVSRALPTGARRRSRARRRRDERGDSRAAGARPRRHARHLGLAAAAAVRASAGGRLSGRSPLLPDHAAAQRVGLAERERPGRRAICARRRRSRSVNDVAVRPALRFVLVAAAVLLLAAGLVLSRGNAPADDLGWLALELAVLVAAALAGGHVAARLEQPAVLGE